MNRPPAPPHPDHPRRGDVIAGKYQVDEIIGAGGMGVVVAARHVALRQRVAVKFLLPAAMRLPEASARFLREARAAVAIQSEHVARVLDVGTLENGAPFMVMEHLTGMDLSRLLKQRGALPVPEAVEYILQAGEAIAEAHTLGIVHRDLKPGNLFLTTRPEGSPLVKVLDFGLSKMEEEGVSGASLTASEIVVGSPHYMSPEQLRSLKNVDARTDLWALGVILYELVTGQRPFDGPSLTAVCAGIIADTPKPMAIVRREIPTALDHVVRGCLEKSVERRTSTMAELARGLAPFAPPQSRLSLERIVRFGAYVPPTQLSEDDIEIIRASEPKVAAPPEVLPAAAAGLGSPPSASWTELAGKDVTDGTTLHSNAWGQTKPIGRTRPSWLIALGAVTIVVCAALAGKTLVSRNAITPPPPAIQPTAPVVPSTAQAGSRATEQKPIASAEGSAVPAAALSVSNSAPAGVPPERTAAPSAPPGAAKTGAPLPAPKPRPRPKAGTSPLDRLD